MSEELQDHLDSLWEDYLTSLDIYTKAREEISRELSTGFISLSQARFKSSRHRNYGQDDYDARMKASLRVKCDTSADGRVEIECFKSRRNPKGDVVALDETRPPNADDETADVVSEEVDSSSSQEQRKGIDGTTGDSDGSDHGALDSSEATSTVDPIKWFGILVPNDLRTAQTSFTNVILSSTADASNASHRLQTLEAEIRRTRRQIAKDTKRNASKAVVT